MNGGLLPGLDRLRHYERAWLKGDLLAGVTVAAYMVPQVMAYAVVAGLPPVVGLWALVAALPVYALSRPVLVGYLAGVAPFTTDHTLISPSPDPPPTPCSARSPVVFSRSLNRNAAT